MRAPKVVDNTTFIHLNVIPLLAFSTEEEEEQCLNDMYPFSSLKHKWHVV
jgi:hypothetical protein